MTQQIYATIYNGNGHPDRTRFGMSRGYGDKPWSQVRDTIAEPLADRGVGLEVHLPWGDTQPGPMTYSAGLDLLQHHELTNAYSDWDQVWEPYIRRRKAAGMRHPVSAYMGTLPRDPNILAAMESGEGMRSVWYYLNMAIQPLIASGTRPGFDAPFISLLDDEADTDEDGMLLDDDLEHIEERLERRGKQPLEPEHWSVMFYRMLREMGLQPYLEGPPFRDQWIDLEHMFEWRTTLNLGGGARARVADFQYIVDWRSNPLVTGGTMGPLDHEIDNWVDYFLRQAGDLAEHWQAGRSVIFRRADLMAELTDSDFDRVMARLKGTV